MKNGLIGIIFLLAWVVACSKDKGDQSSPSITINHPTEGSTVGSNFSMV
ncbi:MAG: hypothetical protein JNJ57_08705, partial [Saprospiraceae bacterium]|nr:hypothetical protein [Saprospiraceae bacterium]